ncbi:hypothetical protein B296_00047878 [Ensete ventricosum]|uniref:Uncharacterized protein n=1 Tax=Ensete ventricosum TaxID=4639 RepID=A0A426YRB6_ENSVE|nr:hypothetical protein B296_00047878 [Ensete ventricosum]
MPLLPRLVAVGMIRSRHEERSSDVCGCVTSICSPASLSWLHAREEPAAVERPKYSLIASQGNSAHVAYSHRRRKPRLPRETAPLFSRPSPPDLYHLSLDEVPESPPLGSSSRRRWRIVPPSRRKASASCSSCRLSGASIVRLLLPKAVSRSLVTLMIVFYYLAWRELTTRVGEVGEEAAVVLISRRKVGEGGLEWDSALGLESHKAWHLGSCISIMEK